jgi:hypothetical protein
MEIVPRQQTTGKTEEGKEIARWNAARHGIRSPAPVVPGIESREEWERHLGGVLKSLAPEGHLEVVLAERVALFSWRLNRVTTYETESIALYQEKAEDDLAQQRCFSGHVLGAEHPEDVRDSLKAAQSRHRRLKRFPKLPDDKKLSRVDEDIVLWDVMEYTGCVAKGEIAEEDLLEGISLPGVPEGVDWEDYEGRTVGGVRAGVEAIAQATGEDPEKLLEYATDGARRDSSARSRQRSGLRRTSQG